MTAEAIRTSTTRRGRRSAIVAITKLLLAELFFETMLTSTVFAAARVVLAEPVTMGGMATFRRLSEEQYKRSIENIFGSDIKVPGQFDPPLRDEGLLAIGDSKAIVSPSGFEQYQVRAWAIAVQVLVEGHRGKVLVCTPRSPDAFDRACAMAFFGKYGRMLYRRPLSAAEMSSLLRLASAASAESHSFYKGLEIGLSRLLVSPNFIFRIERTEPDPERPGARRLDDYALATRISFLLWNAPPDDELLDEASKGHLRDRTSLQSQVDRLIDSPRFAEGVRSFFSDMFAYDQFDGLSKDQSIYPKFTTRLAKDAKEQVLRTIVDLLVTNKGDYRDLFTTKKTFLNRNLGSLYKVLLDDDAVAGWSPYTFGPEDPRAGILTFAAFLMLDPTHEGKTSPTIRGKSTRELLLCQKIPAPPGNVDFSKFNDPKNPNATVRERLTAHRENPTCAGCHGIIDPLGLSMENYDGIGSYRMQENGAAIDASGTFEGKHYTNLLELEKLLHDSSAVSNCVVERSFEYGVGRPVAAGEREWLKHMDQRFADEHYVFSSLMRDIALSREFQTVSADYVAAK
jgi:hypothetical protein